MTVGPKSASGNKEELARPVGKEATSFTLLKGRAAESEDISGGERKSPSHRTMHQE